MRCELRPISRVAWSALPIALMLAVAPAAAVAQSTAAVAQSMVCQAVRRGESATQVARRLTGDARNTYQTSFQIMNSSSRFVPKSQYNRIRAGWQACVIKSAIAGPSSTAQHVTASDAPEVSEASTPSETPEVAAASTTLAIADTVTGPRDSQRSAADILRTIGGVDLTMVWLGVAMVVPWFGWRIIDEQLARRRTTSIVMRHFAHRFVDEFERPLVRDDIAVRPVRARLRTSLRRGRFDILLAPGKGRRYPNMADHKKNVEYDVARVIHSLADDSFVSGPVHTDGGWVVVPFQFKAGPKQPGVTCISSF
jgi:hypothetical protein